MKTAIYIEDGVVQLVLTGENEFERNALGTFEKSPMSAELFTGTFYDCRGGWTRQSDWWPTQYQWDRSKEPQSLIIRMAKREPEVQIVVDKPLESA